MKNNLDTMKNMLLYPNRNMQQVCKYGLAAMIFFMGTFPMSAQIGRASCKERVF